MAVLGQLLGGAGAGAYMAKAENNENKMNVLQGLSWLKGAAMQADSIPRSSTIPLYNSQSARPSQESEPDKNSDNPSAFEQPAQDVIDVAMQAEASKFMGWQLDKLSPELRSRIKAAETPQRGPAVKKKVRQAPPKKEEPVAVPPPPPPKEESVTLVIPIVMMGKPRMTQRDKWKKRDVVERFYAVKDELKAAVDPELLEPDIGKVSWKIWLPMPKSWTLLKKAHMLGKPHRGKPDRDNLDKGVLDILFKEDSGIHSGNLEKYWDDGDGPRIELKLFYEMNSTKEHFREEVLKANDGSRRLRIERYCSQDGKCATYEVEILPSDGYDQLVKESYDALLEDQKKIVHQVVVEASEGAITGDFVNKCADEQRRAWEKRINQPADQGLADSSLTASGDGWFIKSGSPDTTVLLGLRVLSEEVHQPSQKAPSKWGKTRVKKAIASRLPIGKFIGRMNLDMDNVDDVSAI